jgi:hypothetical protein
MNKTHALVNQIKIGLAVALLAAFTGCVGGYVDGGGYGGAVVVPGPDVGFYGGGIYGGGVYERGGAVRGYSHRGAASRGVAHGGGGGRGGGGGGRR